jgi:hypothetical protein
MARDAPHRLDDEGHERNIPGARPVAHDRGGKGFMKEISRRKVRPPKGDPFDLVQLQPVFRGQRIERLTNVLRIEESV